MNANSSLAGTPLQAVACDLCGSGQDRTFLTLPDMMTGSGDRIYRLAECRTCGLIFLNPRPYEWDIPSYYPETYAPFVRKRLSEHARNWLHRRSVRELRRHLGPGNRVLDLGCGTGELLEQVRASGNADVIGIEPAPLAAQVARNRRGLDVRTGTLERAHLPDESIDTVMLSHVLEHLPSPSSTMQAITRILKPGGVVIIWVPNARSVPARVLGQYWMGWDVPRHFYAFTPGSLHRLITKSELLPGEVLNEKHAIEWAWGFRLFLRERWPDKRVDAALAVLHPLTAAALTPLGIASALLEQSGRIRMIARKPVE